MRFLFACGCPRSGTTVLWRLLRAHPKVAMGVERYIDRVIGKRYELDASYFSKERFYTYTKGDTHFPDITSAGAGEYYRELEERYDACKYYGDKIPPLYEQYDNIFKAFDKVAVVFIFRNIFDVAQSYMKRLAKPDDAWDKNVDDAIREWNLSLRSTIEAKKKGHKIFVLEYEEVFYKEFDLEPLFNALEIRYSKKVKMNFRNEKIFCQRLEEKRDNSLSSLDKRNIIYNADFDAYREVIKLKNSFS